MADTIFINDDGTVANLNSITGKSATPIGAGKLRLFTAPGSVDHTTLIGSMVEATFTGYAAASLSSSTWASAAVSGHVSSSQYGTPVTFTCSGAGSPQSILGWYITDAGATKLYACAKFAAGAVIIQNPGDSVSIGPTLTDQSLN